VLALIDPQLATPVNLSSAEFRQLVAFLRKELLDPKASSHDMRKLIPAKLPSGRPRPAYLLDRNPRLNLLTRDIIICGGPRGSPDAHLHSPCMVNAAQ